MKVVDFLLLATASSAAVALDVQSVLFSVHGEDHDDSLNDADNSLLAPSEEIPAHGLDFFLEGVVDAEDLWSDRWSKPDSWLNNVKSGLYGRYIGMILDEDDIFDQFDQDDVGNTAIADDTPSDQADTSGSSNMTIYQLITSSRFTTKLAALIEPDNEFARLLRDTSVNHTVFVPTDAAFDKISKDYPDLSPSAIRKIISYHISPGNTQLSPPSSYGSSTLPTLYKEPGLGADFAQRLTIHSDFNTGLSRRYRRFSPDQEAGTVNFYAQVVASDIPASNGIVQAVDSILMPPPATHSILNLLPTQFSALSHGLARTNLTLTLEAAASAGKGGTLFAPTNGAFDVLGPRITAFLFSPQGEKYLRALLQYHIVRDQTLYPDVLYIDNGDTKPLITSIPPPSSSVTLLAALAPENSDLHRQNSSVELQTMLGNQSIAINVKQLGPFTKVVLNGCQRTTVAANGPARDGSIVVIDSVLVPPKKGGDGSGSGSSASASGRRHRHLFRDLDRCLTIEEFKARFEGLVGDDDEVDFELGLFGFLEG